MKATSFTKRALALALTVVMLVSCWVFCAPTATEASAATAGSYDIKLTFKLDDGLDNLSRYGVASYIRVYYVGNNGTNSYSFAATDVGEESSLSYQDFDLFSSTYLAESQKNIEKELPMNLPGFPVKILCYQENKTAFAIPTYDGTGYHVTKMTIKNSSGATATWDTLWEGDLYVFTGGDWRKASVKINGGTFQQTKGGNYTDQATASNASGYSSGWSSKVPVATSITDLSNGVSSMSVPTSSSYTDAGTAFTYGTVKDQYGVNWYQDPTLTVVDAQGNSISGASIVNKKLRLYNYANRENNYTAYIKESCGSASNTNKSVSITTFDYNVTFYDTNFDGTTGSSLKTQTVDYGASATPPAAPAAKYTASQHKTFSGWTGDYESITTGGQNVAVTAAYNAAASHGSYSSEVTTAATCTAAGVTTYTCGSCAYNFTDSTLPAALGHAGDDVAKTTAPGDGGVAITYYECSRCHTAWGATYSEGAYSKDAENEQAAVGGEPNISAVAANTSAANVLAPAPSFNSFSVQLATSGEQATYLYKQRGASLRLDGEPVFTVGATNEDTYTDNTQTLRFTASLMVPAGVSYDVGSGLNDNVVTDFGFVYTQDRYISSPTDLVLGSTNDKIHYMSVAGDNSTRGAISSGNWKGVTVHTDNSNNKVFTFNLLLAVYAGHWNRQYATRPYITYTYHGQSYTVYDGGTSNDSGDDNLDYSHNSVAYIAYCVANNPSEGSYARSYCQTKIVNNLSSLPAFNAAVTPVA